jgi:carboxyl-terminal processing protease
LQIETKGKFSGIGIEITLKDRILTVVSPIEGTPAYQAGLKAGDQILKINGTPTKI